jgi:hypothetical protein
MKTIKICANFENKIFKIRVQDTCTVAGLQIKLRKYLKMTDTEACFIFFKLPHFYGYREKLFQASKLIVDIQRENYDVSKNGTLEVKVLKESTFGSLNRSFVKAKIKKEKNLFCSVITYSYYGLYHWNEQKIHDTLELATEYLLKERCNGHLSIEIGE